MSFCFKTLHELAREATETPATALKMLLVDSRSTGVKHKQPAANASAWLPHITAETRSSCQQWISAPYLGLQIFPNVLYVEMRFQTKTFNTLCDNYHKSVPVQLSLSTFFPSVSKQLWWKIQQLFALMSEKAAINYSQTDCRTVFNARGFAARTGDARAQTEL